MLVTHNDDKMVRFQEPAFFCSHCTASEKDAGLMVSCPNCNERFCKNCYSEHHLLERTIPREANEDERWALAHNMADRLQRPIEQIPRLQGGYGTLAPAAANPFIYKRGTGRPDEPPEGAGAPNIAKINRYILAYQAVIKYYSALMCQRLYNLSKTRICIEHA
jgi:hypothetical protein